MTMTRPTRIPTTTVVAIGFLLVLISTTLSTSSTTAVTAFQLHDGLHHGSGGSTKSEQQQQQHSRRSRLVVHPKQQINHDEKHPLSNDSSSSFGGSVVDLHDRAKECAQNKGKCSFQEVQDLKDGLHRERLHNYMIHGSPRMEYVLLEEELDMQLKSYKELLQSEETSSSPPLLAHHQQQLFPQDEEEHKEDIFLDEFMKELQPHLKDRDDGSNRRRHRSAPVFSSPSSLKPSPPISILMKKLDNMDWFRHIKEMMTVPWNDESASMIVMKESIFICLVITVGFLWTPTMTP